MSNQASLPVPLPGSEADVVPPSPVDSIEWCGEHEEYLSMFCLDDLEPLCKQCAADSHAGHRVYLLTEAASDCKEELKTLLSGLNMKMGHFKQVQQTYQHSSKYSQAEAKLTEELMMKEFAKLHTFLRQEEAARLLALKKEKEEKMSKSDERIDRMNQVIKSLEQKIQLIEGELDAEGDGADFLQHYQGTMNSTWISQMEPQKLCRPLIDVATHLGNLQYVLWEKIKHIAPYTPITLDSRTAGQSVRLSPGLNGIRIMPEPSQGSEQEMGEVVPLPANPERFHPCSCVLAREGFNTGVHCWEIEVGGNNNWTLGVAAQSLSRKGEFEACPEAGLWCIRLRDGEYRALTTPSQILNLDSSHLLNRVRVKLDCDEGILQFMNADSDTLLFTFRHCFAEIVYPYFESISVGASLAVLAQKVDISMGSDCVSQEDTVIFGKDQEMKAQSSTKKDITTDSCSNSKMNTEHVIEDKKAKAICSVRMENTNKFCEKEKTLNNTAVVKKQTRKPKFNVTYHVSLNRALNTSTMNMTTTNKA
ncbi:nuclear factor 7, brain-like [Leuresthes tenuis]|uniref:nuclear factor 7, brain-like n=1 Tax=Leuresthes tenuis TaxID=355514 RepID=UPI003B506E3F